MGGMVGIVFQYFRKGGRYNSGRSGTFGIIFGNQGPHHGSGGIWSFKGPKKWDEQKRNAYKQLFTLVH